MWPIEDDGGGGGNEKGGVVAALVDVCRCRLVVVTVWLYDRFCSRETFADGLEYLADIGSVGMNGFS